MIIGTAKPAIVNISTSAVLNLDHSLIEYDPIIEDQLNFRSVINGNRTNTHLGDYGTFKVTVLLWKYSNAKTAFNNLIAYYHQDVYFQPHRGAEIQDSSENSVPCFVKSFKPFYYKGFIKYDAVTVVFETNKYHDFTKLLV